MGDWTGEGSKHCERAYASHQEKKHFEHPMHFDFDSSSISSVRLRTPKSYPLRTLLMLINRANNIFSSRNRLEMVQSLPTSPWQLALGSLLTFCLLLLRRYFAVTLLLQLPSTLLSSLSISLFSFCINTLFLFPLFFDLGYSPFGEGDLRVRTASTALLTK